MMYPSRTYHVENVVVAATEHSLGMADVINACFFFKKKIETRERDMVSEYLY